MYGTRTSLAIFIILLRDTGSGTRAPGRLRPARASSIGPGLGQVKSRGAP